MVLNASKTKVMLFGNSKDDVIELQMDSYTINQVDRIKYLGVWLDPQLAFSLQVDYSVAKAKEGFSKDFHTVRFPGRNSSSTWNRSLQGSSPASP